MSVRKGTVLMPTTSDRSNILEIPNLTAGFLTCQLNSACIFKMRRVRVHTSRKLSQVLDQKSHRGKNQKNDAHTVPVAASKFN